MPQFFDTGGDFPYPNMGFAAGGAMFPADNPAPTIVERDYLRDTTNLANPLGIFIDGNYVHVGVYGDDRYTNVDVSTKTAISVNGTVKDTTHLPEANGVCVVGDYAYVTNYSPNRLAVIDISTLGSPSVVTSGSITTGFSGNLGEICQIADDYLILFNAGGTGYIIDISSPAAPSIDHTVSADGYTNVAPMGTPGDCDFAVSYEGGNIDILDVSTPTSVSVDATLSGLTVGLHQVAGATGTRFMFFNNSTQQVLEYEYDDTSYTKVGQGTRGSGLSWGMAYGGGDYACLYASINGALQWRIVPINVKYPNRPIFGEEFDTSYTGNVGFFNGGSVQMDGNYIYVANRRDCSLAVLECT